MKLLFSESQPDYGRYLYPYVIWALPEEGEAPADLFNAGFLPAVRGLEQFCLCRNVRVDLGKFELSSENRRILRKGAGVGLKLLPRAEFELTPARRDFYLAYADVRYGKDVMPPERLDLVFNSPLATHVLLFTDAQSGGELGAAVLYLELPRLAFYRYSFYDLKHFNRSLGMFMMTSAVELFAARGARHVYLGTCYSERALYKTQFAGVEFFNGFRWSDNLAELKYLLQQDQKEHSRHLLEREDYRRDFCPGGLRKISEPNVFRVGATPKQP